MLLENLTNIFAGKWNMRKYYNEGEAVVQMGYVGSFPSIEGD